jgi:hypothetical protein
VSGPPIVSGNTVTVDLTNVANAQRLLLGLSATDVNGQTMPDTPVSIGFLLGDTTGDGVVNGGDAIQTRGRSGQGTDATNFRSDINVDGSVSAGDTIIVRGQAGNFLP